MNAKDLPSRKQLGQCAERSPIVRVIEGRHQHPIVGDVEVGVGNPSSSCSQWIQSLAGDGLVWYPISHMVSPGQSANADQETMEQACDLTDGTQELYIEDAGGQTYGNSICNQEEQNGWTPEDSLGPVATVMQQAGQQQAQAQASESAAVSQQQAISQTQQQLLDDIGTLESDSSSLNTNTQLAGDVQDMKSDYQTEGDDYQEGGCSQEYGDDDAVGSDADSVSSDQDSLNDDIQSIQSGASDIQNDMQAVKNDIAQLDNDGDGAAPSQDPSSTLKAGKTAVSNADAAVKWATGQGNSINSEAEQLATTAQDYASQRDC